MTIVSFRLYSGNSLRIARANEAASNDNLAGDAIKFCTIGAIMENDSETIGGYAVPVDPMDMLQCDSCQ
jgi:hypothetical protein